MNAKLMTFYTHQFQNAMTDLYNAGYSSGYAKATQDMKDAKELREPRQQDSKTQAPETDAREYIGETTNRLDWDAGKEILKDIQQTVRKLDSGPSIGQVDASKEILTVRKQIYGG